MMRSLFAGVSGLKTHQTRMDVIGNNIANVNTTAYKASSMTFSALMSQTTQKASGANANTGTGGVNARQIGLGVRGGAININITGQGASQSTGNPLDIMINGENFFVVSNGGTNYFTRDGSFYIDGAGNLAMTSIGYNVMGWQVDPDTGDIKKDTVSALRVMNAANRTYPPEATTQGYMSGIIDRNDKDVTSANGRVVNLKIFDSLGYSYTAKFVFKQSADTHEYSMELDKIIDSEGKEIVSGADAAALMGRQNVKQEKPGTVTFVDGYEWNGSVLTRTGDGVTVDVGQLVANGDLRPGTDVLNQGQPNETTVQAQLDIIAEAYGYGGSTDEFLKLAFTPPMQGTTQPDDVSVRQMLINQAGGGQPNLSNPTGAGVATGNSFDVSGRFFDGETIKYDSKNGDFAGIGGAATQKTFTLNLSALGPNFENVVIDMSQTSNVDNKGTCTIGATNGADDEYNTGSGRRVGEMIGISIQNDGKIYSTYDNGMTKLLGQIATARFANASGLEKQADNLYSATLNSGEFDGIGVDITAAGDGSMSTGQLEMSNVDLSSEFTEMITTQRGFQANSRIITVSDSLLEELTNLKR